MSLYIRPDGIPTVIGTDGIARNMFTNAVMNDSKSKTSKKQKIYNKIYFHFHNSNKIKWTKIEILDKLAKIRKEL